MAALGEARELGFLGEAPLEAQVDHAVGFAAAAATGGLAGAPGAMLDLGSGGGIPGLVLASAWPDTTVVLLDSNERRCEALRRAVRENGWDSRVRVVQERAERAGRDPALRGAHDLVVARSFGPPAVTAECAAPFLCAGGLLVVSEPPVPDPPSEASSAATDGGRHRVTGHPGRWPAVQLEDLGLVPVCFHQAPFGYQVLRQMEPCPERFPRREGIPAKRPLY